MAGRSVEGERRGEVRQWLRSEVRSGDGEWFDERRVKLLSFRQALELGRGMLERCIRFEDAEGRRSLLVERRFVSMDDMHLAGLELTLTAENWSADVTVRAGVDGRIVNDGARLYRKFDNRHLDPLGGGAAGEDAVALLVRTRQSRLS